MVNPKDDTEPRSPFKNKPPTAPSLTPQGEARMLSPDEFLPEDEDMGMAGPGCMTWGILGLIIFGMALLIVGLAGTAGWTNGQDIAHTNATATANQVIGQQLARLPNDVAEGNLYLVSLRLNYLAALTPAVPGVAEYRQTATALYLTVQPTITPTPSSTPTPTTESEITEEAPVPTVSPGGYDLTALMVEAQQDIDLAQYDDAIETLDAIIRIDPNFQRTLVRSMMLEALTTRAAQLFNSTETANLAEAIRLTDLADDYGQIGELDYERLVAELYLDAIRTIGTQNHAAAITSLTRLYNQQTTYKGISVGQLLFDEYVAYGEAFAIGGDHCSAAAQYNSALSYIASGDVSSRRDTEQTLCQQGSQLTLTPGAAGTTPIAPVGQP